MTIESAVPAVIVAPLLPIRDLVVFPKMVLPLFIGRPKTVQAVQQAMGSDHKIILVTQRDSKTDDPSMKDLYTVGTYATVLQMLKLPDGTLKVLVEAHQRVTITDLEDGPAGYAAKALRLDSSEGDPKMTEATRRMVLKRFNDYARESKKLSEDVVNSVNAVALPGELADAVPTAKVVHIDAGSPGNGGSRRRFTHGIALHRRHDGGRGPKFLFRRFGFYGRGIFRERAALQLAVHRLQRLREPRRFDALVEVAVGADALAEGDVEVKSGHGYQN